MNLSSYLKELSLLTEVGQGNISIFCTAKEKHIYECETCHVCCFTKIRLNIQLPYIYWLNIQLSDILALNRHKNGRKNQYYMVMS